MKRMLKLILLILEGQIHMMFLLKQIRVDQVSIMPAFIEESYWQERAEDMIEAISKNKNKGEME